MAGQNLGPLNIKDTYQDLVQISGSQITDGTGSLISALDITASDATSAVSASHALVADLATQATDATYAQNTITTGKNLEVTTITKGTPLYFTGSGTSGNIVGILRADAGNPARMPAGGIAGEDIATTAEGVVLLDGYIGGVNTSLFASGDEIFVAVGGGYTNVAPTGSTNQIQHLGNVEKSDVNGSGVIQMTGEARGLPNITSGYFWVGDANGVPQAVATSSISVDTGSLLVTASVVDATTTYTKGDGSTFTTTINNVTSSISASYAVTADSATTATTATTANTASYVAGANVDGTVASATSASYAVTADSATTATTATSASYATTASFAENAGTPTLQQVTTEGATTSVQTTFEAGIIASGSTNQVILRDSVGANQGTIDYDGVTGNLTISSNAAGAKTLNATAYSISTVAVSASAGFTGSLNGNADTATSASYATSASQADNAISSSYALTASYVPGAGAAFPFVGDAEITGSLAVDGWINADHVGISGSDLRNMFFGTGSGVNVTTGIRNTAMGSYYLDNPASNLFSAGYQITTGNDNTFYGVGAGTRLTGGSNNTAVGVLALGGTTTGQENTAVGQGALRDNNGSYNVGIGKWAGYGASGQYNAYMGYKTGFGHSGWRSVILGNNAIGQGASLGTHDWFIVGQALNVYDNLIHGKTAGTKYLGISGSLEVTGSATINDVLTLNQQDPLPTGAVGQLAVSASNLYYHNGTSWAQLN